LDETAPVRIKGDAEIIHIDETVTALLFTKEVTIEYLNERGEVERQEIFYKITSRKPKGLTLRMNASELPARR
jgi:hypothetical protein